jgi:hypothetical protein
MDTRDPKSTIEKKDEFLAHLRTTCNVGKSAEAVGIDRSSVYRWRNEDPQFEHDIAKAKKDAVEALEDEAHRRAFEGTLVADKYGIHKVYSDTLAIFLLKAHDPKYKETVRNELTGANGEPLNNSDDQVAVKLAAIMQAGIERRARAEAPQEDAGEDDLSDLA